MTGRYILKYGNSSFTLNRAWREKAILISPKEPPPVDDPLEIIRRSLEKPLDLPPLHTIVTVGERVGVVIPDVTRYSGTELILPLLIEEIKKGGVRDRDISLFIALGIHRKLKSDEICRITGGLSEHHETIQHDPDKEVRFLGRTSRGTPVYVNEKLLERDRIVVTGTLSFHYFAGFGGGRKSVVPGLAGRETCHATHKRVFRETHGKDPLAASGVLEGNPVHEDMLEAAEMVRVDFSMNSCVTPGKKIFAMISGSLRSAHLKACDIFSRYYRVSLEGRLPLVVASAGGYPKDINFIQSHKSLENAFQAVLEGGTIVLVARCQDGFGHPDFFPWFDHTDLGAFEDALRSNYMVYGQTAFATLYKARRVKVILVSDLPREDVERMGMTPVEDLDEGMGIAERFAGGLKNYYLIPEAGSVVPVIAGQV